MHEQPSLPLPTVVELKAFAGTLTEWTDMAARAFGLYSGANHAISSAKDKATMSAQMANELRQQLALMAVVRCFAVLDRSSKVSFQSMNRLLKNVQTHSDLDHRAIARFQASYSTIDFEILGRLQSFRNKAIAHVTWNETQKFFNYGELERMVRICCKLAHEVNLMTSGLNNDPLEHFDDAMQDSLQFWSAVLRDDPDPFAMTAEADTNAT